MDKEILEIAAELDLTRNEGFLKLVQRMLQGKFKETLRWTMKNLDEHTVGGMAHWEKGNRIEITIRLPIKSVLAGRKVEPKAIVDVFQVGEQDSRSIALENDPTMGECFRLSQRYYFDEELNGRLARINELSEPGR